LLLLSAEGAATAEKFISEWYHLNVKENGEVEALNVFEHIICVN